MENRKTLQRDLLTGYDERVSFDEALSVSENIAQTLSEILGYGVERINTSVGPTFICSDYVAPPKGSYMKIEAAAPELEFRLKSAAPLRINASPFGERTFVVEFPNPDRKVLGLKTLLASEEFAKARKPAFPVGAAADGSVGVCSLDKVSNLIIGGRAGSGRDMFLHDMILGLMYGSTPDELRFVLIDTKSVEFVQYSGSPYLLSDNIYSSPEQALEALNRAKEEMEKRYKIFSENRCRNISEYNEKGIEKLPHIAIVVSELADLIHSSVAKDIEITLRSLMSLARASGIHIILSTMLLSTDVVRGVFKANTHGVIAFKTSSEIESRLLLDRGGAQSLIGCGDVLYRTNADYEAVRLQTGYITSEEIERVNDSAKNKYDARFTEFGAVCNTGGGAFAALKNVIDPIVPKALYMMTETGKCSVIAIQRAFNVGYNRAVSIRDYCEEHGYVVNDGNEYKVNITREKVVELFGEAETSE